MKKIVKIFSVLIMIILSITLIVKNNWNEWISHSKIADINKNKSITVGYIPYNKSFIVDPNTWEFSWIFYEVMQEVWSRLNIEINYKYELWWSDLITAIDTNKIDMMVTWIWPSQSRSKFVDYIEPLYYSPVYIYTQYDNSKFDNNIALIDDTNVKIWIIDWEITSSIAHEDFPKAYNYSSSQLTNVDQLMLDLVANKTDITFLEASVANNYIKNNPRKIKQVISKNPIRKFDNSMLVKKWETELKLLIDTVILELKEEWFISEIIDKYKSEEWNFIK